MDVRCERCNTEYEFDDSRITEAGVTVKCTTCGHVFKVKKKALVVTVAVKPGDVEQAPAPALTPAPAPAPAPAAPPPEKQKDWKVRQASGNVFTFKELTTLQKWIVERKVARDDEISLTGDTWKRLGDIGELASFFQVVDEAQKGAQLTALQTLGLSAPMMAPAGGHPTPAAVPGPPPIAAPAAAAPAPAPQPAAAMPSVNVNVSLPAVSPEAPRPAPAAQAEPARGGAGKWIALLLLLAALGGGGYYGYAHYYLPLKAQQAAERERAERLERERTEAEQKYQVEKARADEEARLAAAAADAGAVAEAPQDAGVVNAAANEEPVADAGVAVAKGRPEPRRDFDYWMNQGDKLRERDKAEAALDAYGKAAELKPDRAEPFAGRGLALLDMGANVQAEAAFRQALKLNARYGVALMGLAETYRTLGRNPDAVEYYRKYLEVLPSGPDAPVAKKAIERLGQ